MSMNVALRDDGAGPAPGHDRQHIAPIPRVAIQAFCAYADTAALLEAAGQDRRMVKAHLKVQTGGASAAAEAYRSAPTPNVIIIESDEAPTELLMRLDELAMVCDAGTKVVVLGHVNDVSLYRDLVRRGVSDYLILPMPPIEIVRAISGLFSASSAEPVGKTYAIVGAKGGVGASTVAHNVAWAIARDLAISCVVADLDLPFGTAGLDFNQDPPQGIAEAVFSPERVDQALIDRLLSKCTDHLSLLAAPATLDRPYDVGPEAFDPILDALRGNIPAIVLDVPHLWCAWVRRTLVGADEIVLVATPDLANLRNAKNMLDLLKQARPNDRPARYVLNMVGVPKRPEIKVADFAKAMESEPLAVIPFDPQLFGTAANNGQMLGEVNPSHKSSELMRMIAQNMTGRVEQRRSKVAGLTPLIRKLVGRQD